jgi:hypothetical protein
LYSQAPFRRLRRGGDACTAAVDRAGWSVELGFQRFGFQAGIRSNSPDGLGLAVRSLPPRMQESRDPHVDVLYSVWAPEGRRTSAQERYLVFCDGGLLARTNDAEEAAERLETDLQIRLALHAEERIFVHAGVVTWNGSALLLPGVSYSGKSTLVDALVRAGAGYFSDEYAVLTPGGGVEPYDRPLRLRNSATRIPLPNSAPSGPARVAGVLFTEFHPSSEWRPSKVAPAIGAAKLLSHAVAARLRPAQALHVVQQIAHSAVIWESPRPEAGEAVPAILRLLDSWAE